MTLEQAYNQALDTYKKFPNCDVAKYSFAFNAEHTPKIDIFVFLSSKRKDGNTSTQYDEDKEANLTFAEYLGDNWGFGANWFRK